MAVRLRLRRIGKKKQPQYRLVAAEAAGPRDGRFIEALGHYNPKVEPPAVSVNEERALWWLRQGAQPTDTARALLVRTGVWERFTGEPAPAAPAPVAEPEREGIEPAGEEVGADEQEAAAAGGKEEVGELSTSPEEGGEEKMEEASTEESEHGR